MIYLFFLDNILYICLFISFSIYMPWCRTTILKSYPIRMFEPINLAIHQRPRQKSANGLTIPFADLYFSLYTIAYNFPNHSRLHAPLGMYSLIDWESCIWLQMII